MMTDADKVKILFAALDKLLYLAVDATDDADIDGAFKSRELQEAINNGYAAIARISE